MAITPLQCKVGREILKWKQEDLARAAKLGKETIGNFERGKATLMERTLEHLEITFNKAGVTFEENDKRLVITHQKETKDD